MHVHGFAGFFPEAAGRIFGTWAGALTLCGSAQLATFVRVLQLQLRSGG